MIDLSRPWTELPYVVLDVETTGVDASTCGVVEVAAVRFEGGFPVAKWSSLVYPGCNIPEAATAIHGIDDLMVVDSPSLAGAADEIARLTKGAIPCAYNATFDRAFLAPVYSWYSEWLDPLVIVRDCDRFVSGQGRHKLEAACARYGVELQGAHRAEADAIACGALLWQLHVQGKVKAVPANKLLQHISKRRAEQEQDRQAYMARKRADEVSNG